MSEHKMANLTAEPEGTGLKTAATATAREMLEIPGFRERVSERQENSYEPHDAELANSQLDGRVAALFACLQRAKAHKN